MKIFVSGASGFMGRHLVPCLQAACHEVTAVNSRTCDLTRCDSLDDYRTQHFDYIYHLAAWTQAGDFCDTRRGEQWLINQQINTHALAWWHGAQPQAKFIAFGTSVSYSREADLTEENYLLGVPLDRYIAYATAKRSLLVGLQSLNRQFGHRFLYLIPSTLFGPGYHTDGRQLHFIYDLIRKILRGKLHGDPVVLWGDGYQRRELVYVDDFVRILLQLAETCNNEAINIGAGQEFSIREFAQLICRHVNYDFNTVQFDPAQHVGAKSKCLAIHKLRRLLPEVQFLPLEVGLSRTINWFLQEGKVLLERP